VQRSLGLYVIIMNICDTSGFTCSKSGRGLSEIEQSSAKLL